MPPKFLSIFIKILTLYIILVLRIVGQDLSIIGEFIYIDEDPSPDSVSLNHDGTRVAFGLDCAQDTRDDGIVRVFDWDGNNWLQVGDDIVAELRYDRSGSSISLSSDGQRVAVGSPGRELQTGIVRVYEWNGNNWVKLGSDIVGEERGDIFGYSVAMDSNGSRLVIGGPGNDANASASGHARVFEWTGSEWEQMGTDIDGLKFGSNLGRDVAINNSGARIALGATGTSDSGRVRVFDWSGTTWEQIGDIRGESGVDRFGQSLALNAEGNILAVGAPENDGNGNGSGHVRVYEWRSSSWIQVGTDIDGEASLDNFGSDVALSANGSRLTVTAPRNEGNLSDPVAAGHIRVYDLIDGEWNQILGDINIDDYGGYTPHAVSISGNGQVLSTVTLRISERNNTGQCFMLNLPPFLEAPTLALEAYYEAEQGVITVVNATPVSGYPEDFQYQWFIDGFLIPESFGGREANYQIAGDDSNVGSWKVRVTNSVGETEAIFEFLLTADADEDGLTDGQEIYVYFTDPNNPDSDGDGLNDGDEVNVYGSDPLSVDSDNDGIMDGIEARYAAFGFDPAVDSGAILTAFHEAAAELPGVLTDAQNEKLSLGGISLGSFSGNSYSVNFIVEKSTDLSTWTTVDTLNYTLDVSDTKEFIRVRAPE